MFDGDVPVIRVTFLGYFSGTDAYIIGFFLGPVHIFSPFPRPLPFAYICTLSPFNQLFFIVKTTLKLKTAWCAVLHFALLFSIFDEFLRPSILF